MKKPKRQPTGQPPPADRKALYLDGIGPVAVGTGLVALDIVVSDREGVAPRTWAGGTCGNVLAILAFLGWRAYPAATLGDDAAAEQVLADLEKWGVDTRFLRCSVSRHTPVVLQRIRTKVAGAPRHRWVWTCPNCGAWLPGYQAVLASDAQTVAKTMPAASVFFFDRVSRGALNLARACAQQGGVIVFEPSGIRDERLFQEAVALSDIVKYSHQRLGTIREVPRRAAQFLEIQTLGSEGLRYRLRRGGSSTTGWREMSAYSVQGLRDTAGAGDWCTAGLLHTLARTGAKGFSAATGHDVERALRLGQALAAIACRYEGARGSMYALSRQQLDAAVHGIMEGQMPDCTEIDGDDGELEELLRTICPSCDGLRKGASEARSERRSP